MRFKAFFTVLLVMLVCSGFAETLVVGKGGRFQAIQEAINAAGPGDIVLIKSGQYVQDDSLMIDEKKKLEIRGEGKVDIACTEYVPVFYITRSQRIMISNIHGVHQVTDPAVGKGECGPGATIITAEDSTGIVIQKCELNGCGQTGFEARSSDKIVLDGNYIHDNVYSAVTLYYERDGKTPDVTITNNRLEGNFGPVIISPRFGLLHLYDRDTKKEPGIVLAGNKWKDNDRMPRRTKLVDGREITFWGEPYLAGGGNVSGGVLDSNTEFMVGGRKIVFLGRSQIDFSEEGNDHVSAGFTAHQEDLILDDGTAIPLAEGTWLQFTGEGGLYSVEFPDGSVREFSGENPAVNEDEEDGEGE
jgi:hypothetical protein